MDLFMIDSEGQLEGYNPMKKLVLKHTCGQAAASMVRSATIRGRQRDRRHEGLRSCNPGDNAAGAP
jgi:uncharacterized protein (UPF0261 family)